MYHYEDQANWTLVSGQQQSPINILTATARPLADKPMFEHYKLTQLQNLDYKLSLTGHGQATLQQRPGQVKELHFHHPSEHHIDGVAAALEAHFVHEFANGQKAVVAILFNLGAPDPALTQILTAVPQPKKTVTLNVTVTDWFQNTDYYHYIGSLTTPPVYEGIEWYVAQAFKTISPEQLQRFTQLFPANNRDIQALNQRPIFYLA